MKLEKKNRKKNIDNAFEVEERTFGIVKISLLSPWRKK